MSKSQASEHVDANLPSTSSPRKTRSSSETLNIKEICIFCDASQKAQEQLVNASTLGIGPRIVEEATKLKDYALLAKVSSSDFVALEVKYHKSCCPVCLSFTPSRGAMRSLLGAA